MAPGSMKATSLLHHGSSFEISIQECFGGGNPPQEWFESASCVVRARVVRGALFVLGHSCCMAIAGIDMYKKSMATNNFPERSVMQLQSFILTGPGRCW